MPEYVVELLNPADAEKYAPDAAHLYRQAGWIGKSAPETELIPILRNAYCVMGAWDESGHLIGMMRALSDGVSDAYLLDMVVEESHRRKGLAHEILRRLNAYLKEKGIDWIVCISVPGAESLYSSSGKVMEGFAPFRF
jgi:spermidine synthase